MRGVVGIILGRLQRMILGFEGEMRWGYLYYMYWTFLEDCLLEAWNNVKIPFIKFN